MPQGLRRASFVIRQRSSSTAPRRLLAGAVAAFALVAVGPAAHPAPAGDEGRAARPEPAPRILSFEVDDGARETTDRNLTLTATFDRQPTSYRVAEGDGIRAAPWLPTPAGQFLVSLELAPPSRATPFGPRTVRLQVRSGPDEASLSAPSELTVVLAPARTRTYLLAGAAAARFVEEARRRGARFDFEVTSASPDGFAEALCGTADGARPAPGRGTPDLEPGSDDHYTEHARFEVFQGVELNPFWQLTDVQVGNSLYRHISFGVRTNQRRPPRHPESFSFEPHLADRQVLASRELQLPAPAPELLQQVRDRLHGVDPGSILPALPPTIDCVSPGRVVVRSLTLEGPDGGDETFDPVELALAPPR